MTRNLVKNDVRDDEQRDDIVSRIGHVSDVETLAERIRWILETRGWSEREFEQKAKLKSKTHVNVLLRPKPGKERPAIETIQKLAEAAGVEMHWLATGDGPREALPVRLVVTKDRLHGRFRELGEANGYSEEEIQHAESGMRGLAGTASIRDAQVLDALAETRIYMRRMQRIVPSVLEVADSDELPGGIGDAKRPRK